MLQETKYYTPEIEELYIGLECFYDGKPHKIIASNNLSKSALNHITLKHLDQEDIESFEFIASKYNSKDNNFNTFHKKDIDKGDITLTHDKNDFRIVIEVEVSRFFNGFIKNKSELKKLLKELNIN
jgi:hypothetical protein